METKVEQLSLHHWLRQGNDLPLLEWISWFILVLGVVVGCVTLFIHRIPYGRYGSETTGLFYRLGLTSCKIPAKIAWFFAGAAFVCDTNVLFAECGWEVCRKAQPEHHLVGDVHSPLLQQVNSIKLYLHAVHI